MISVVHRTTYNGSAGGSPVSVTIPATTGGNTLVVVEGDSGLGGNISFQVNLGSTNLIQSPADAAFTPPGANIWYLTNIPAGQTVISWPIVSPGMAVIYELTPCTYNNSANDQGGNNVGATEVAVAISGTGNCVFFTVIGQGSTSGNTPATFNSVSSPWTLDYTQSPLYSGLIQSSSGASAVLLNNSGPQQATFSLTGPFSSKFGSTAIAFSEAASSQNIIVQKRTNPAGSSQVFNFRPSWGANFTLTDGNSNNSGNLAAGTYSVSEDPVPGFTTTTNIDPSNIVLGTGQTITVVFTNTAIVAPCVPLIGGVMVDGILVPDLSLFIGPSTELYKNPILNSAISFHETYDEGRNAIVLDFNNSDGLYSRDLGTIFEWPVSTHDVLYVWQPSIIPMPETIYSRASDWDDGGYTGDKFIQGITIEADSFGAAKTFQLQSSDDLTLHTLNEMPTTFLKQTLRSFSCNPFISHSVRIVSSDGVKWRVWGSKLVFQPLPPSCIQWQTELVSLGMIGWFHNREMNIPHISTADLTLTLTFDSWPTINLTIPNSGGKQIKTKVTLPANKCKLVGLRLISTAPFRLFESDLEMKVKPWGSGESYTVLRPFGGDSSVGAKV